MKERALCPNSLHTLFVFRWCEVTVSLSVLHDLLPGPVTLVFKRKPELNPDLNPATELIGVRIPDHQFIREIARICKEPIALTSANRSAAKSCLRIEVDYNCPFHLFALIHIYFVTNCFIRSFVSNC